MKRTLVTYASVIAIIAGVRMVSADGFRPGGFATLGANTFTGNQTVNGQVAAFSLSGNYVGSLIIFGGGGGKAQIFSPVDGQIKMQNNAGTADSSLETSTHIMQKVTTSGTAPGAGFARLEVVAGTTGGTCKLQAYAGISTTPTTILDDIGSGC